MDENLSARRKEKKRKENYCLFNSSSFGELNMKKKLKLPFFSSLFWTVAYVGSWNLEKMGGQTLSRKPRD